MTVQQYKGSYEPKTVHQICKYYLTDMQILHVLYHGMNTIDRMRQNGRQI